MVTSFRSKPNIWHFLGLIITFMGLGVITAVFPRISLVLLTLILSIPVFLIAFYRPHWIIFFLTAFMPFESLVLKFLPVSGRVYLLAQLTSEALIYITFFFVILKKLMKGQSFSRTPIDIPLVLFIGITILSIVINQSPVTNSLLQLRTLFRYTFLFYLIINLDISARQVNFLLKLLIVIGLVQLIIGLLQLVIGGPINQFLLPRQVGAEIAGQTRNFRLVSRGREIGSIYGTLGDTVYFGYFLLFVLSIYLSRMRSIKLIDLIFVSAIFFGINYSFSRAAVFGFLFVMLLFFRSRFGLNRSVLFTIGLVPLLLLGIMFLLTMENNNTFVNPIQQEQSIVDNIMGVFTRRYVEVAQKQRLGHLLGTAPTILANKPFLGYGPDEDTTINQINKSDPNFLLTPLTGHIAETYEDVFWVAILGYYGLSGVFLLIYLLYKLYYGAWKIYRTSNQPVTKSISLTVIYTVALSPILLFFNQTLEFRIYGFYFWLFPAIMFALAKKDTSIKHSIAKSK